MEKIILCYDMDAFFASVEENINPKLKNIPFVVGGGVVSTANYKAREYGIKSAMPIKEAYIRYGKLVVIEPKMSLYHKIGKEIQNYLKETFNIISFTSIDEGYLDITDMIFEKLDNSESNLEELLNKFAIQFMKRIYDKFRLTCSIGIGYSKITAKIATEINKPNGYYIFINEDSFYEYIKDKKISIIPGFGKKTVENLRIKKINTIKEMLEYDPIKLYSEYTHSRVNDMYNALKGYDTYHSINKNKSISLEKTFYMEEYDKSIILAEMKNISKEIFFKLKNEENLPKTINIKFRNKNFETFTKSKTIDYNLESYEDIYKIALKLLEDFKVEQGVRLIGIGVSNFKKIVENLKLF